MGAHSDVQYAYLTTLFGVVVAAVSIVYTTVRSLLFQQSFRSHTFTTGGNFTARQFGNFTGNFNGPQRFGYVSPYGGFVNDLAIIGVIIAIVGIVWLAIALKSQHVP